MKHTVKGCQIFKHNQPNGPTKQAQNQLKCPFLNTKICHPPFLKYILQSQLKYIYNHNYAFYTISSWKSLHSSNYENSVFINSITFPEEWPLMNKNLPISTRTIKTTHGYNLKVALFCRKPHTWQPWFLHPIAYEFCVVETVQCFK